MRVNSQSITTGARPVGDEDVARLEVTVHQAEGHRRRLVARSHALT